MPSQAVNTLKPDRVKSGSNAWNLDAENHMGKSSDIQWKEVSNSGNPRGKRLVL